MPQTQSSRFGPMHQLQLGLPSHICGDAFLPGHQIPTAFPRREILCICRRRGSLVGAIYALLGTSTPLSTPYHRHHAVQSDRKGNDPMAENVRSRGYQPARRNGHDHW